MFSIWNYRAACIWDWQRVCPWFPAPLWSWLSRCKHTYCTCRDGAEAATSAWQLLAMAGSLLPITRGNAATTEHWAHRMPCCKQVTDYCLPYLSPYLQWSSVMCVHAAWCIGGSWKPMAAPSPGTMKPQLQSGGNGGTFNSASRCHWKRGVSPTPGVRYCPSSCVCFHHFKPVKANTSW